MLIMLKSPRTRLNCVPKLGRDKSYTLRDSFKDLVPELLWSQVFQLYLPPYGAPVLDVRFEIRLERIEVIPAPIPEELVFHMDEDLLGCAVGCRLDAVWLLKTAEGALAPALRAVVIPCHPRVRASGCRRRGWWSG